MTSVLAMVIILHFSWYHEYIALIFFSNLHSPMIATFDYPVWIRLAKDGLTVIGEHILPCLVMSGHYFTSRDQNFVIAAIVKAPVGSEPFKL